MTNGLSGVRADRKLSYRKIEARATQIRENLQLSFAEALDALNLFENLDSISIELRDGKIIPFRYGVETLEDSEGYARYDQAKNILEILASEETYSWLERQHPRAAYFVAHELGHCVLHTDQLVRLAKMPTNQQAAYHRGRANHAACEDTEWQANAFASALLMPARGLDAIEREFPHLPVSLIAARFRVSREAATYRREMYLKRKEELLM